MMKRALLILILVLPSIASARSERQGHIPNGRAFSCDSCHGKASLQVRDLTPFGVDVNRNMSGGVVQWQNIWNLDSDGDGFSNGLELNDPNGTWRRGQADPAGPIANPGTVNAGICGNSVLEAGEDCEELGTATCQSLGLGGGQLECRQCRWYTYFCGVCGDGVLNPLKEDCDLNEFGDNSCAGFGFLSGDLACTSACKIDSTDCNDEAPAVCGDNVLSRGEQCDGDQFGTVDCARLNYASGTLQCTSECKWNASACIPKDYTPFERPDADMGGEYDAGSDAGGNTGGNDFYNRDGIGNDDSSCSAVGGGFLSLFLVPLFARRRR